MSTCMTIGSAAKLAVQGGGTAPRTFNDSSERYDFLYETLTKKPRRVGNRTIKGDLSDWEERNVEGSSYCTGVVAFNSSPLFWSNWMTRVIGEDTDGTNPDGGDIYVPGTNLPSFDILIDKEAEQFHFQDCYVNRCVVRGQNMPGEQEPEVLTVVLQIIAKTRVVTTAWPSPEPDLSTSANALPDTMAGVTFEANSTSYPIDRFVLSIDHNLIVRFRNGLTPSCIRPGSRRVRLQTNNSFLAASFAALHDTLSSPIGGKINISRGSAYSEFVFGVLDNVGDDPSVRGKTEVPHVLDMNCLRDNSAGDPEITGTAHTP